MATVGGRDLLRWEDAGPDNPTGPWGRNQGPFATRSRHDAARRQFQHRRRQDEMR